MTCSGRSLRILAWYTLSVFVMSARECSGFMLLIFLTEQSRRPRLQAVGLLVVFVRPFVENQHLANGAYIEVGVT